MPIFLLDTYRRLVVVTPNHVDFLVGHLAHAEPSGHATQAARRNKDSPSPTSYDTASGDHKAQVEAIERA